MRHLSLALGLVSLYTGPAEWGLMARWPVMAGQREEGVSHKEGGRSWLGKAKWKGQALSGQR